MSFLEMKWETGKQRGRGSLTKCFLRSLCHSLRVCPDSQPLPPLLSFTRLLTPQSQRQGLRKFDGEEKGHLHVVPTSLCCFVQYPLIF